MDLSRRLSGRYDQAVSGHNSGTRSSISEYGKYRHDVAYRGGAEATDLWLAGGWRGRMGAEILVNTRPTKRLWEIEDDDQYGGENREDEGLWR